MTPKQVLFVQEYLVDLNATQAAMRAGYSEKTAYSMGQENLKKPEIAAAIAAAQSERSKRTEVTADRVLQEYAALAFYDPADIAAAAIDEPADIAKLPEHVRRAIVGWKWDKDGNLVLSLSPKTPSLDALGKHLGMFREQIDVNVKTDLAAMIAARRKRVAGGDSA